MKNYKKNEVILSKWFNNNHKLRLSGPNSNKIPIKQNNYFKKVKCCNIFLKVIV